MKTPFAVCVGLSVACHGALVAGWSQGSVRATPTPQRTAPAVQVSLATGAAAPQATAAARPGVPAVPQRAVPPAPPLPAPAQLPHPGEGASDPAAEPVPEGPDVYVPRPQLSVVPQPLAEIRLAYPPDGPSVGRFVATLTLYIDEEGWVRRVQVDDAGELPAAVAQAARASFAGARFSPGQVEGRTVKSRIRVEAVYESVALPSAVANALPAGSSLPQ